MTFNEIFGKGKNPNDLDIYSILVDATNNFISNHKKRIVTSDKQGIEICFFTEEYLGKFIGFLAKKVESDLKSYLDNNFSKNEEVSSKELTNSLKGIVDSVNCINENIINGMTYTQNGQPKRFFILPKISNNQDTMSRSLTAIIDRIDSLVKSQQDVIKQNSKVIEEQHNRILRYENDVLLKTKTDLIMELIGISDQIKLTLDEQSKNKDYTSLLEAIKNLGEWVDGSFQTESVRKYEISKKATSELNTKYQEVTECVPTDNPKEHGHYKTLLPGYFWTLPLVGSTTLQSADNTPRFFKFVLRPELVAKLVYSKEQNTPQPLAQIKTDSSSATNGTELEDGPKTANNHTFSNSGKEEMNTAHLMDNDESERTEQNGVIVFGSDSESDNRDGHNHKKK